MSNEFYCKFCEITCNGKSPYEQHLKSTKHLKKSKLNESLPSFEQSISTNTNPSSPIDNTFTPSLTTNDSISEDSSISSTFVSISPETMRILLEWNHPRGYKPYCDICQLPLHGDNNADIHFNSTNNIHNQKLAAWKQIHENDAQYSCKVCWEIFSNENIMSEHFNTDSHEDLIQQKHNLKKFILIYQTYNKLKQFRKEKKDLETSPVVNDNLSNQFQALNVIDATEQKTIPSKPGIFSSTKLLEIMKKRCNDDD